MSVLVQPDGAGGLADHDGDGLCFAGDRSGSPVACTKSFGHREIFVRDFHHLTAAFDDSVAVNDERTIELSDFLGIFLNLRIHQVAVFFVVSAKWVDTAIAGMFEYLSGIANDEQRSDWFAFASLVTNLSRQINNGFNGLQGNAALQHLQVAAGQTSHALVQLQMADGVKATLLESTVDGNDFAVGANQFVCR